VGPRSAGADPGPVCYGKGGEEPTVTDAHAVLGRLNPAGLLGGGMPLDVSRARAAIAEKIARPLGLGLVQAAEGIVTVVNANMIRGIRRVSVERGHDPRDFDLIPFGGAGPLHGADLARALNIRRVIVPAFPGIASAFGMLSADVRHDYVRTRICGTAGLDPAGVGAVFAEMESLALDQLAAEGFRGETVELARSADLRYLGQSYELGLPVPPGDFTAAGLAGLVADFHRRHARAYGYAREEEPVELVNLRLVALGRLPRSASWGGRPAAAGGPSEPLGRRPVIFDGRSYDTPVFDRGRLFPGRPLAGPAVIEQLDATTVVPPGCRAAAGGAGTLILEFEEA
jgi:N-methylhydantoinase A